MAAVSQGSSTNVAELAISVNTKGSASNHGAFGSGDEVAGEVEVSTRDEARIETVRVYLTGKARTRVEHIVWAMPSVMKKRLLRMHQTIRPSGDDAALPAQGTRTFQFSLTIPHGLPETHCLCPPMNDDDHLQVPPTMGGWHRWEHDGEILSDPTPDMVEVCYKVTAIATLKDPQGRTTTAEIARRICIVPSFPEAPPQFSSSYRIREESIVKRNILSNRLGCLVMEAQPPSALKGIKSGNAVSCRVLVRFDPASHEWGPPPADGIMRKIHVTTIYTSGAALAADNADGQERSYTDALSLPPFNLSGVQWLKKYPGWEHMQLSNGRMTPSEVIAPSAGYVGGVYYLLKLSIPVEFPAGKILVPTFRSCLVSRTYELEISLSLSSAAPISVRFPLQICT